MSDNHDKAIEALQKVGTALNDLDEEDKVRVLAALTVLHGVASEVAQRVKTTTR